MDGQPAAPAPASERPRLNLKPRDPEAARMEEERRRQELAAKGNPFGAARPREAILADRTGKKEEELLAEEARRAKLNLRLNAQQLEEKRAAEAQVQESKDALAVEGLEASQRAALEKELADREGALTDLLKKFEAITLEKVEKGEITRQSELRARQQLQQQQQQTQQQPIPGMPMAPFPVPGGRGGPYPMQGGGGRAMPNFYPGGGRGGGGRGYPGGNAQHYNPSPVPMNGGFGGMMPPPDVAGVPPPAAGGMPAPYSGAGRGGGRGYYNNEGRGGRGRGGVPMNYPPPPARPHQNGAAAGGPRDFFDSFGTSTAGPMEPPGFGPAAGTGYVDYQAGPPAFKQDRF